MGAREEGYYGPSHADLGYGAAMLLALGAVGLILLATLCAMSFGDEAEASNAGEASIRTDIAIDVTDQWAMHGAGLPTKADVLAWHMYGRWGFYRAVDGTQEVHIFHDLPGGAWVWDALYGLDPENPAFKFKQPRGSDVSGPLSEE